MFVNRTGSKLLFVAMALVFSFTACSENASTPGPAPNTNAGAAPNVKSTGKPQPDTEVAVIETADYGRIVIELYPNIAPKQVERFKKLITEKFYDGTAIHRIEKFFGD